MMLIYGQKRLFGAFVRKNESETSEFLRTDRHFCPICPQSPFFEQANYGQSTHFLRFVRKRQSFCQMQRAKSVRQALSQIYRQTVFCHFRHGKRLSCIRKDQICNLRLHDTNASSCTAFSCIKKLARKRARITFL